MKIICFKPQLSKYWKNGWSSEEIWSVNYTHYGIISDELYSQIQVFQSLFKPKPRAKETEQYIASQVNINNVITEEQLNIVKVLYKEDIEKWQKLQKESNLFFNTVCEFIVMNLLKNRYIRCVVYLGEERLKLISIKWFIEVQILRIKCIYNNFQLRKYYKRHPFKYYENYYPGIEKDRKAFFQMLSVTLSKIFKSNGK